MLFRSANGHYVDSHRLFRSVPRRFNALRALDIVVPGPDVFGSTSSLENEFQELTTRSCQAQLRKISSSLSADPDPYSFLSRFRQGKVIEIDDQFHYSS